MKKISLISILLVLLLVPGFVFANGDQEKGAPAATAVEVDTVKEAAMNYFANFPGNRIIKPEDVFAKMDAGEDMLVLDIRKAADYAAGHIKGSVNAYWGPELAAALEWLPDDVPVYVTCYTGQTAGQAVALLNVAGIQAQSIRYGYKLGVSKVENFENYQDTVAVATPDASGVKYDPAIKAAVEAYFNAIPEKGSNIWPAAKVKEALDAEEDIFVLSIRQQDAYDAGHIEGAALIPWGKGMQEKFESVIPMDKQVVVHCYSGQTAGQATAILRLLGYNAVSMKSGMGTPVTGASGWANEGFPVVQ